MNHPANDQALHLASPTGAGPSARPQTAVAREISHEFPFESHYLSVRGSRMHYVDVGEGETILFLHGNPTSSYLWRNVIPHLQGQARCIAVDLIGMGKSARPDIDYTFDEQYAYLAAFIEKLGIGDNLTLVIHDWGSGLGLRWAADHPDQVRAVGFMEAMVRPLSTSDLPGSLRTAMKMMRTEPFNWLLVGVANLFLRKMLPDLTHATMSGEVLAHYASYYPTVASRRAVRQWPKEVPFDGNPDHNYRTQLRFIEWLQTSEVPKILLYGDDGVAIKPADVETCRRTMSNLDVVDLGPGKHFLQETHPHEIGEALSRWYAKLPA